MGSCYVRIVYLHFSSFRSVSHIVSKISFAQNVLKCTRLNARIGSVSDSLCERRIADNTISCSFIDRISDSFVSYQSCRTAMLRDATSRCQSLKQ